MVDFDGFHVGKYTSPMEHMGYSSKNLINHTEALSAAATIQVLNHPKLSFKVAKIRYGHGDFDGGNPAPVEVGNLSHYLQVSLQNSSHQQ